MLCRAPGGRGRPARASRLRHLAAAALVGVPAFDLTATKPALGAVGPWLAVGVFGVGIVMNLCARPSSLGWILLVLYVTYGGPGAGSLFFGGVLSAFVGAAVMTPVADLVARQRTGPPAIVSFTPAFWLLVPGALGLVGVAALLNGDSTGTTTLVTTVETMVAIALGVLVGRAISVIALAHENRNGPSADDRQVKPRHAVPPGRMWTNRHPTLKRGVP
jgi:uncharacterized membrane protein YjjB (DUF3815 family)